MPPRGGWDDLIDVEHDEPIDPFSGLIGMSPSILACEYDLGGGDDRTRGGGGGPPLAFGPTAAPASSSCSVGSHGTSDEDSPRKSSLRHSWGIFRRDAATDKRPSTKGVLPHDEFDPLHVEDDGIGSSLSVQSKSLNNPSVLIPLGTPPRHYKDDPLLSKSRYRHPWSAYEQRSHEQRPSSAKNAQSLPRPNHASRSATGGSVAGGECMLGKISQLEVSKVPVLIGKAAPIGMPRNQSSISLDLDESLFQLLSGQGSIGFERPIIAGDEALIGPTTPNVTPQKASNDRGDDDESSIHSFSEEFRRQNKGIVREVKFILNPVVSAGKKLLRQKSDGAALKRADGCLT